MGQQVTNHPAQHLAGSHPVFGGSRLQFEGLPTGKKEWDFDHFLIQTGQARRSCFKHRMHDDTCAGMGMSVDDTTAAAHICEFTDSPPPNHPVGRSSLLGK